MQQSSKTTSSRLIMNLVLSDLAVLVLSLPVGLLQELASWPFGELGCKIFFPLGDVFLVVSITTLMVISLDRYRAVVTPFKKRLSKNQATVCIVLIWVVCYGAVGVPTFFLLKLTVTETGAMVCYPIWPSDFQRRLHKFVIASLVTLPLFIIAFCYCRVVVALWRVRIIHRPCPNDPATSANVKSTSLLEQKRRLVKMLIVIVICFTLCFLPYVIFALVLEFGNVARNSSVAVGLVAVLALFYANSAVNPLILCIMSKDYRRGLQPCRCAV